MHIRPESGTSKGPASSFPPFSVIFSAVPSTSSLAR